MVCLPWGQKPITHIRQKLTIKPVITGYKEYADNLPTAVIPSSSPFWHFHFTFLQNYRNFLEYTK